ncbi:MAG TPA: hypothetical protein VMZ71_16710 [Gemmataceae bacterium]|nr:hypothetical protein [Gemmataceae bacterium]
MRTLIAAGLVFGLVGLSVAQDKKNDPTGTWKYTTERNGQKVETTLKLKLDGDKLTGTVAGGRGGKGGKGGTDAKIEDGKFKDGEVSFTVTRERGDTKIVSTYKAKVDGDTMKGTAESKFGDKDTKTEFEAKREKVKD